MEATEAEAPSQYKSVYTLILIAFTGCLGQVNVGFISVILNATYIQVETSLDWPKEDDNFRLGVATGVVLLGAVLGNVAAGYISDHFGRRSALLVADIIIISGFWLTYSENFVAFCIGRCLEGVAIGIFDPTVYTYVRELAPQDVSGKMTGGAGACGFCSGILLGYGCAFIMPLTPIATDHTWRWVYAMPAMIAGLQLLLLLIVLRFETPTYYLIHNEEAKAKEVLELLYKEEFVDEALAREHEGEKSTEVDNLFSKKYSTQIMLSMFMLFSTTIMGTTVLNYYSTYIFLGTDKGDPTQEPPSFFLQIRILNFCIGLIKLATTVAGSWFSDHLGRKTLLIIGYISWSLGLLAFAYFGFEYWGLAQRIMMLVMAAIYGITFGAVLYTYMADTLPAKGVSFMTAWDSLNQLFFTTLFPILVNDQERMNWTFAGFGVVGLVSLPVVWLFVLETKNKSLNEIYKLFHPESSDDEIDKLLAKEETEETEDKVTIPRLQTSLKVSTSHARLSSRDASRPLVPVLDGSPLKGGSSPFRDYKRFL